MTPRIHLRCSTLTAVSLLLAAGALWQPTAAQAVPGSYSGALSTTDPTFNRPLTTTSLSGVGTNVYYDVQPFFLTLSSNVTLAVTSANFAPSATGADDSFLALYQGAFIPSSPLTNLIGVDDDTGPGSLSLLTIPLTAFTSYFFVTTAFSNLATGSYSDTITPANAASIVLVPLVPEPSTWAMAVGGLGLLVAGQRFRRTARHA